MWTKRLLICTDSIINVKMLLVYMLLLTLIPITQQYCGVSKCVSCRNRTCCLQCESGYDGCLCTDCKNNNCALSFCLETLTSTCNIGCKDGWYGPRCDNSCGDCPSGKCDFFRRGCQQKEKVKTEIYPIIAGVTVLLVITVMVGCCKHCSNKMPEVEELADNTDSRASPQRHLSIHNTNVTRSGDNDRINERSIMHHVAESGYHGAEGRNHRVEARHHRAEARAPPLAVITLQLEGSPSRYESGPAAVSEQPPPSYDSLFRNKHIMY